MLQVPLGTVVHKLVPAETPQKEEEEPFTFQQHWVGARDYVSSDEESENEGAAMKQNKDADLEVSHLELFACLNRACPLDTVSIFDDIDCRMVQTPISTETPDAISTFTLHHAPCVPATSFFALLNPMHSQRVTALDTATWL